MPSWEYILQVRWKFPFPLKKSPYYPINTCKIDYGVKTHSEISKKKIFLDFFGYDICKTKALTPHTYVQGTTHSSNLG